ARRLSGRRGVPDPGEALRGDRLPGGLAVLGVSVAHCVKLRNLVRLAPNQIQKRLSGFSMRVYRTRLRARLTRPSDADRYGPGPRGSTERADPVTLIRDG